MKNGDLLKRGVEFAAVRFGLSASVCALLLAGAATLRAQCQGPGAPTNTETRCVTAIPIGPNALTSFDISWVDPERGLYFLGDRSNKGVDIVSTATNTLIGRAGGFVVDNNHSGPDGVVSHGRWLYAGDGDSTLKVFDISNPTSPVLKATISTGGSTRLDEMALSTLLLAVNNAEDPPFATLFAANGDNASNSVVKIRGPIEVDSAVLPPGFGLSIEQPAWDEEGDVRPGRKQQKMRPAGCTVAAVMAECANFKRSGNCSYFLLPRAWQRMSTSSHRFTASSSRAQLTKLFFTLRNFDAQTRPINREQVRRLKASLAELLSRGGRASKQLAAELQRIERECRFTSAARAEFQTLLGALGLDSAFPIQIPVDSEPSWSRYVHPLKHHRSHAQLPPEADVVIIGAGLTGASAAYHLRHAAAQGRRVVVIDRGSPAGEASGRNAGNFELLPENSVGTYDGLARERLHFLSRCYPTIPREVLRVEAERQSSLVFSFAIRNRDRLKQIIEQEQLACDFSPKGWLYLAHTEREEQAICDELALATGLDQQVEIWSRMKIRDEFGFDRAFIGRFVPGDGTYHPAKFVYGVLQVAVNAGVDLYTSLPVRRVYGTSNSRHVIETDEGSLLARSVIVATNAFTRQLFPELKAIRPAQSQISLTEFAPDRCRGRAVTCEEGPVYFNQPRGAAGDGMAPLLLGGGKDRPMRNPSSRRRSPKTHARLLHLRDRYFPELRKRPFSTEWIGPIALTPDQLPAMGFLKPGIIVAAGFNGYGGSYCVAAGEAAADMAISGIVPDWLPEDVFSPQRLLNRTPLFFAETNSLWCYAASLCVQLRATNRQLLEALKYSSRPLRPRAAVLAQSSDGNGRYDATQPAALPLSLQSLKPFRGFSDEECAEILPIVRARSARKGEILSSESHPGDACFVIVKGAVEVSFDPQGGERLPTRLGPSSIFGQLALIDGGGSNGTYTVHQDALLLEMKHDSCHQLLARHSPLAYKFLAALTDGVIDALRGAERQLKRLNGHHQVGSSADS